MSRSHARRAAAALGFAALAVLLAGCSGGSAPSLVGIWKADDGSGLKTVDDSGACTGMYYNGTKPLDIGGGMTCQLGEKSDSGDYLLVVRQPPNERTYRVEFVGDDTAVLRTSGGETIVTLERQ